MNLISQSSVSFMFDRHSIMHNPTDMSSTMPCVKTTDILIAHQGTFLLFCLSVTKISEGLLKVTRFHNRSEKIKFVSLCSYQS